MALQVIGAGLGRTGTLSLKLALEHIGLGPCYHMTEMMSQARRQLPLWFAVIDGKPDWDAMFEGFASTVDYPTTNYWRELAAHYPAAKVILSDRDAEGWYASIRETIFAPQNIEAILGSPVSGFMRHAVIRDFEHHLDDRDWMIDYFGRWRAEVVAGLPPERLLVHRAKDGWEPLCAFLGVPVPAEPYPRVNSKDQMKSDGQARRSEGDSEIPVGPEAMEERMQAYIASMRKLAWG